jgi:hypothetical protein
MASGALLSTLVMGAFLVLVVVAVLLSREWREVPASVAGEGSDFELPGERLFGRVSRSLTVWQLVFLLLTVGYTGAVVVAMTGTSAGAMTVALLFAPLLLGYVLFGVYFAARGQGHSTAKALAETLVTFGAVLLVVIVGNLLFTSLG